MLNTGTPEFLQSSVGAQSILRALGVTGQAAVPQVYEKAWDVGTGAVLPNFPVRQDGFPFYDAPLSADVAMKPVTVSVRIDRPREDVFSFLDVLANHAQFTDHMLVDWSFEGPAAGVGGKARMRAKALGEQWMEMEVLESVAPVRTVEETVGGRGKRRTRGTYTLDALPDGATDVHFQFEVLRAPLSERLAAPLIREYMRRANAKAMLRLSQTLARPAEPTATA